MKLRKFIATIVRECLNENVSQNQLNDILDKISEFGIESLSNHELKLLKSFSDKSIDVEKEIEKHINKFKTAKEVISTIPLKANDVNLEKNIGRYVRFKNKEKNRGLLANMGMIYEIIAIQKHWGDINGEYVPHKIGYRIAEVGRDNDFGRVGDVDEIEFINMTEEDAISINNEINKKL
jgi:hypothetical protein